MATEKRLIDADVLIACFEEEYKQSSYPYFNMNEIEDEIIKAPTVDAVEVKHGRWIRPTKIKGSSWDVPHCSLCNKSSLFETNYCSNCGAKMDGDENG